MKRMLIPALACLLLLMACAALGEGTEEEGTVKNQGDPAPVLRFSSFSGGGYTYSAWSEDPTVVRCDTQYVFEPHAEEIDGAAYDYLVTLTGLKAGSTAVRIYGESPILNAENWIYTVTVDRDLRVTLTPVRALSFFYVYRSGESQYDSYQITLDAEGYRLSVSEGPAQPVDAAGADALMQVIDRRGLASWDGFSGSRRGVREGERFWLDFTLTDGTRVHAVGENVYPEQYLDAMDEIWQILLRLGEAPDTEM